MYNSPAAAKYQNLTAYLLLVGIQELLQELENVVSLFLIAYVDVPHSSYKQLLLPPC